MDSHAQVHLGDGAQPIRLRDREQEPELHPVAGEEGHALQHRPPSGVLTAERLDQARQLGEEEVQHGTGRQLRDAPAALGLQLAAVAQRTAVEALDVGDLGVGQQRTEQAVYELGMDVGDVRVDPADQVALEREEAFPECFTLAREGSVAGQDLGVL